MSSANESAGVKPAKSAPTIDLHEIQATVLRQRLAPYFGTHVLLRVDSAQSGQAFLRRLMPHVASASDWWNASDPWLSDGISYAGLEALGIPQDSSQSIEFLQQEWINDGNFIGLGDERDPIIGLQEEGASFTVPRDPVRRLVRGIETFNVLRGGEYFFMPSLSALNWIAKGFQ